MVKLVAIYPILYLSKQYDVGDELPANDLSMVDAWLEAETAEWRDDDVGESDIDAKTVDSEVGESSIASAVTAEAGLGGDSDSSETDENLVGKIPKTANRSRK